VNQLNELTNLQSYPAPFSS